MSMVRPEATHVLDSHHLDGKVSFVGGRAPALVDDRVASYVHADGQRGQVSPRALVCLGLIHAMTIPSGTRLHSRVPFFMATPLFQMAAGDCFRTRRSRVCALPEGRFRSTETRARRLAFQAFGPIVFIESGLASLVLDADLGGFVSAQ